MKFISLRLKINLAIVVTGFFILLSILAVIYPFERERRAQRLKHIHLLINTIFEQNKDQLANEIYAGQQEALHLSIQQLQHLDNITHVLIYDLDGQLIAASEADRAVFPSEMTTVNPDTIDMAPRFQTRSFLDSPVAQFFSSIEAIGLHVGYIRMLYDLNSYTRESRMIFIFSGILFLVLMVIIVLLNLFLTHSVIRPTFRLRQAMESLQKGAGNARVSISSSDEMGQMASAFNHMCDQLNRQRQDLTDAVAAKETYAQELYQSNNALEGLNATLEERVEARTRELENSNTRLQKEMEERKRAYQEKQTLEKQLLRSKKMETLGLVAGGVAHDLNNVLSGIVSYPDLLLLDLSPEHPMHNPVLTIKESGLKAAAIVQDLLTLTRRGVVASEVLNPGHLVSEYLASPEHEKIMTCHPGIELKTSICDNVMNIKGSALHLKKTIMNLVSNAAEAQPGGGEIRIAVYGRHVDTPIQGYQRINKGDYCVVEVMDAGIGISRQEQEHIFEPFYTKKTMGRSGTGLGMAVVWGTLQDHNGCIDIHSRENRGTTFQLYFPITTASLELKKEGPALSAYMGDHQRILVIDDVPEQIQIATLLLTRLGYQAVSASSGEAAIAYLETHAVDLLILDMIMEPGMDGLDTYRKILAIHPEQRAVIASGFAENDRVKELQGLGAGPYIKKPYTMEVLGKAIKKELDR